MGNIRKGTVEENISDRESPLPLLVKSSGSTISSNMTTTLITYSAREQALHKSGRL
jgi:hypothetical protein